MEDVVLSIIVPIYNAHNFLGECIESIINQTIKNIEIILVDDGSSDDSLNICKKYREKDKRIIIKHKNNEGSYMAKKDGLMLAKGKYVGFVDSDDFVDKTMFEKLYKEAVISKADLVNCLFANYHQETKEKDLVKCKFKGVYSGKKYNEEFLKCFFCDSTSKTKDCLQHSMCNKLFLRDKLYEIYKTREYKLNMGEDSTITYAYVLNSNSIAFVDELLYFYRIYDESMSHGYRLNYLEDCKKYMLISLSEDVPNSIKDYWYQSIMKHGQSCLVSSMANEWRKDSVDYKQYYNYLYNDDFWKEVINFNETNILDNKFQRIILFAIKRKDVLLPKIGNLVWKLIHD